MPLHKGHTMDVEDIKPVDEDTILGKVKVDKRLSLKTLTAAQKNTCIRKGIEKVINNMGLENTIGCQGDFNVAILFSENPEDVMAKLNSFVIPTINEYIETELNEKASRYNRSMILFESEIQKDKLFIRWSV